MNKIVAMNVTFKNAANFKPLHGITYNGLFFRDYTLRNTVDNDFIFECLSTQQVGYIQ